MSGFTLLSPFVWTYRGLFPIVSNKYQKVSENDRFFLQVKTFLYTHQHIHTFLVIDTFMVCISVLKRCQILFGKVELNRFENYTVDFNNYLTFLFCWVLSGF